LSSTHVGRFVVRVAAVIALASSASSGAPLVVEDLGQPVVMRGLDLRCVTRDSRGIREAWGAYEAADKHAMVGVRLDDGKVTWVDVTRYGRSHIQMISAPDGQLYAFTGVPGRFFKYDVTRRELIDLGAPSEVASYWIGSEVGPDGRFYIGTYPKAELVRCDPATGKVENLGRLADDARQKYLLELVVSDDNVAYCPVGLHHGELWAVDANNGARKQILPEALTRRQGRPSIWRGEDGRVYGEWGGAKFLCKPDGIEVGKTAAPARRSNPLAVGDTLVGGIDSDGRLRLTRQGQARLVPTDYAGAPRTIYSVGCEYRGRIFGGTFSPANTFGYDPADGRLTDFGQLSSGTTQVYDILGHERGLFLSSYMNASVDLFDPDAPLKKGENPRKVVTMAGQERPTQEILGPDGMLYTGTVPAKGRLGGALLRVDVGDLSHRTWENIIPDQSILRLCAVPETGEVLGVTTVNGGSSAIPTETEACLFLWDCKREAVAFRARPLPGTASYGAVVRAANGLVYGVADDRYYAFDPAARKTVFTGTLPIKSLRFPGLADDPIGDRGLIYGVGDDAVFAINPADQGAEVVGRASELRDAHGFCVTRGGMLYFGSGAHLMRCKLP
jgi:outer membrane protein assembly factor BamB